MAKVISEAKYNKLLLKKKFSNRVMNKIIKFNETLAPSAEDLTDYNNPFICGD